MTEEAFLRAIAADFDDDAPRLVYADYLDENGESLHAESIRLQCQIAYLESRECSRSDWCGSHGRNCLGGQGFMQQHETCRWHKLRRRMLDIMDHPSKVHVGTLFDGWAGHVPGYIQTLNTLSFRRGFPHSLGTSVDHFLMFSPMYKKMIVPLKRILCIDSPAETHFHLRDNQNVRSAQILGRRKWHKINGPLTLPVRRQLFRHQWPQYEFTFQGIL